MLGGKEFANVVIAAPHHGSCLVKDKYNKEHLKFVGVPPTSFGRYHNKNVSRKYLGFMK